jgi:hypothetical protein
VIVAPVLLVLLLHSQATCADASGCRAAALEAQARHDYEAFHDLAWLAYRKGRQDDAELMLLLARSQSLSGRPTDALVMLQRIMARGIQTDAATSEDFARVRALPRWKELFGQVSSPDPRPPNPPSTSTTSSTPSPLSTPSKPPAPVVRRAPGTPLSFTTLLKPSALAYDAVSRRYLIADRAARRVAVIDESSGQVTTLVGTQASLGDVAGIAIDSQQGDLWIVSTTTGNTMLHRLQLVSGRVISTVPITGVKAPLVGLTFVRGAGLVAADSSGNLLRVSPRGRLDHLAELEYEPRTIASDNVGRIYVSAGGSRLARFSVDPRPGPREVLTLPDDGIVDGGMAIVGTRLHFLAMRDGTYEIRAIPLKK